MQNKLLASGRYEILSLLGEGGMGKVFLATDHNLDSRVVIKMPHAAMLTDEEFVARFQREIRSLVKLRHRSIVSILDVGEQDGVPFAVMQYLKGKSLEDRLAGGSQSEADVRQWLPDISAALDFIHREGYIHRDIKPANILFDPEGNAYISDFGVAKVVGTNEAKQKPKTSLTGAGMVMGTPDYMAPELVMGENFDHRVDQYALAVTIFECLSGRRPFEGATPAAVMVKHSTQRAPSLRSVCPSVSECAVFTVDRALAKKPDARFESCVQMSSAFLDQRKVPTPSGGAAATASQPAQDQVHKLACPGCAGKLRLGDRHAGKTIKCPGCGVAIKVAADLSSLVLPATTAPTHNGVGNTVASSAPTVVSQSGRVPPKSTVATRNPILIVGAACAVVLAMVLAAVVLFRKSAAELASVPPEVTIVTVPPASTPDTPIANPVKPDDDRVKPLVSMEIVEVPDATVDEETELRLTVNTTLPRTGKSRLQLKRGAPSGLALNAATGTLTWTPTEGQGPGTYPVTIELTDKIGKRIEDSCVFDIQVNEVNKPPMLTAITPQIAKANASYKFRVSGSDPDIPANTLEFSLKGEIPEGLSMDNRTGALAWDVSYRAPKSAFRMTVTVADAAGLTVTRDLELTTVPLLPLAVPFDADTAGLGQKLAAELGKQPEEFINPLGGRFRLIPPGEFAQGASEVKVTEAIYMGLTEVTQGQWCSLMGGEIVLGRNVAEHRVAPKSAEEFCKKLTMLDGIEYRLPTESEWEFACRAGTITEYAFRPSDGNDSEKYKDFANIKSFSRVGTAQPVGVSLLREDSLPVTVVRQSNGFGLVDMHGNVAELCRAPGRAGLVVRGGSFQNIPQECVSSARSSASDGAIGLRLVAIPGPKTQGMKDVGAGSIRSMRESDGVMEFPCTASQATITQKAYAGRAKLDVETRNFVGMEFVLIPSGKFQMGAADTERSAGREEKPQHVVEISRPFYLGRYEVSQSIYEKVMEKKKVQRDGSWKLATKTPSAYSRTGRSPDVVKTLSDEDIANLPVESFTWQEANEFCEELSKLIPEKNKNHRYRLPTEAEWEYACRAGSDTAFSFGAHLNGANSNVDGTSPYEVASGGPFQKRTEVVGRSGPANPFGLFDMHGNVWEWCHDFYEDAYYSQSPAKDPQGPATGSGYVLRGGAWDSRAEEARSASRRRGGPELAGPSYGFRVVLEIDP